MREVIAQFETVAGTAPDSYGDAGCQLAHLNQCAMVLRHERYADDPFDSIYLFDRRPGSGDQVFIHVFPAGHNPSAWNEQLAFYERQRSDFRLPKGQAFDGSYLAPAASGFERHAAFRTRDGRTRRRVVHAFAGALRSVLLVYSSDASDLLSSPFHTAVRAGLTLSDAPLTEPFRR